MLRQVGLVGLVRLVGGRRLGPPHLPHLPYLPYLPYLRYLP